MNPTPSRRNLIAGGLAASLLGVVAPRAAASPATAATPPGAPSRGVAFTHATVIDVERGRRLPDTTVVVRGDRIAQVGPSTQVPIPPGVRAVDLRGAFLIPGLVDAHVHSSFATIDPALYVANGVTTVREMSGREELHDWRDQADAGELLGPRWVIASRIIDGAPTLWDPNLLPVVEVATAAEGRAAVRDAVAEGADAVKVYSRLAPDVYRAIVDEARRRGIAVVGHTPDELDVAEASDLGQASIEHTFTVSVATSRDERELRRRIAAIRLDRGDYNGWFNALHPIDVQAMRTYDRDRAARLFDRFARNGTHQVPTLVMHDALNHARTLDLTDPRRRYLPQPMLDFLDGLLQTLYLNGRAPEQDADWAAKSEHQLALVGAMHAAGVPLLAGTDYGTCGLFPGFSLHDELRLLVRAGLSTAAALRAATVEPARFLGNRRGGRIAAGAPADLVVLAADPLADIANTQRIDGLVTRGRYLDAAERQAVLDRVADEAAAMSPDTVVAAGCACHGPVDPPSV
ncbi:amidohydrolase family protein [Jiangella endophytica]|uniref:amidohydrolase family protein n=1 Tax=Jiangella endophytica TaxID=1623398 RepID=UPI000E345EE4|nr:amidohydrolase family protein [Jiangella endophytica]